MKNKSILGWIGLFLLFLSPFIFGVYTRMTAGQMRYTIAVLLDVKAARAGYQPIYRFEVTNKIIEIVGGGQTIVDIKEKGKYINHRYFVMFGNKKPNHSHILLDYPVPDSIKTAPLNGWDSIPGVGQLENPFVWQMGNSPPIKKK